MKRIDTGAFSKSPSADLNLAIDEALLQSADKGLIGPTIRTWSFDQPTVVLGRSSKVDRETDRTYCDDQSIPIYRRCSGGASIVGGPGCLMYSVILSLEEHPEARKIDAAHRLVMSRVLATVRRQLPDVQLQGICDLTWQDRKFSGNALRITRGHLLYHGTILHDGDLDLIARCLDFAPRQPDYREAREHADFITNVPLNPGALTEDLCREFGAEFGAIPEAVVHRASELAADRYSQQLWRFRH